ncbi:fructose-bisphosphatase class III [Candidatus Peregrinibacteria bacterium]|nr:fructose-bisphosphatase class III [Candidatus Peregrinibacteria bacterium]
MARNKIESQIGRIESLAKKREDVSKLAGKEKMLARTYVYKVREFLDDLNSLHPREQERMKKPLFEALKNIDEENMLAAKEEFDSKIDVWSEMVDKKVERRNRFFNIEYKGWINLVPKRMFDDVYESFVKKGIELKESRLDKFEEYVTETGKVAERYREAMAYFFDDVRPTSVDDRIMGSFMSRTVVEAILTGKVENPRSLVTAFEQQAKELGEKVEKCEKFALTLDRFAIKSGPMMQDLVADRNKVIHMYGILIEKGGMTLGTVKRVMMQLTSSEEFKSMAEKGWSDAGEMKQFLMEAVLRGGMKEGEPNKIDSREFKKLRAELYAESLFREEQVKLSQELEKYSRIMKEKRVEMDSYKKEFTDKSGVFYSNMMMKSEYETKTKEEQVEMIDKEIVPGFKVEMPQKKLVDKISKKGNFTKFIGMEKRAAESSLAGISARINMMRNSAKLSMAMNAIHEMANPDSLEDMKSMVKTVFERMGDEGAKTSFDRVSADFCTGELLERSGQFSEVERLRSEYYTAKNEFEEKNALLKHKNLLEGELMYRRNLESGEKIKNKAVKSAVLARKETKILDLARSVDGLEESLERETAFIEDAIDQYGSIYLVPKDIKESVQNKSKTLLSLLGSSMKFISKMKSLDLEIKLLNPEKGLDKMMKKDLEDDYEAQKDLFFRTSEFLNNKFNLPDANIASAEVQSLMLGNLKERIEGNVGSAVDKLADKSRDAGFFFKKQMESKVMGKVGITRVDVLNIGIGKMKDMEEAIVSGRKNLQSAKNDLLGMLSVKTGLIKEHPELVEERNKLINKLVAGIDNLLGSQFSFSQQIEAVKVRGQLQNAKEDMFWNIVKMGVVFALSVAAAMVTGGLASAGAGRLCALYNVGGRVSSVVRFTAGNIGVAAGSTVGQSLAMHATDVLPGSSWGDRVDWSGGALAKDFGIGLGLSLAFSGGGALIGKRLGAHTLKKTGFSYAELSEAGVTKLGFLQKIGEKVYGLKAETAPSKTIGLLSRVKGVSSEFLTEVTQEGLEEMGEAIHPVLGGVLAMANAATGVSTEVEISTDVSAKLRDIGVEFNKDTGRIEFFHSTAKDFGIDLIKNLGEASQQVDCSINKDGTFSLKLKGVDEGVTIHPSQKMEEESKAKTEAEVKKEVMPEDVEYVPFAEKMRKSWNGFVGRLSRAGKAFDEAFMEKTGAVSAFGAGTFEGVFKGIRRGVREALKKGKGFKPGQKIRFFHLRRVRQAKVIKEEKIKDVSGEVHDAVYLKEGGEVFAIRKEDLMKFVEKLDRLENLKRERMAREDKLFLDFSDKIPSEGFFSKREAMGHVLRKAMLGLSLEQFESMDVDQILGVVTKNIELTSRQVELVKKKIQQVKEDLWIAQRAREANQGTKEDRISFANNILGEERNVKIEDGIEIKVNGGIVPSSVIMILSNRDYARFISNESRFWTQLSDERKREITARAGGGAANLDIFNGNISLIDRRNFERMSEKDVTNVIVHEEVHHLNKIFQVRDRFFESDEVARFLFSENDYYGYLDASFEQQLAWAGDEITAYLIGGGSSDVDSDRALAHKITRGPYTAVLDDTKNNIDGLQTIDPKKPNYVTQSQKKNLKKLMEAFERKYNKMIKKTCTYAWEISKFPTGSEVLIFTPVRQWRNLLMRLNRKYFKIGSKVSIPNKYARAFNQPENGWKVLRIEDQEIILESPDGSSREEFPPSFLLPVNKALKPVERKAKVVKIGGKVGKKPKRVEQSFVDRLSKAGKAFNEAFMEEAGAVSAFGTGALGGMFKGVGRGVKELVKGRKEKLKPPKPFDDIDIKNEVYIRRSDGTIEKGWIVVAKSEDKVTVYNPDKKATKIVRGNKLWKLDVMEKRENLEELSTLTKVYVKRKNNKIEKGWNVVTDNPDGTYVLTNDRGTFIKRNVKREDIYKPEEVENNTYEDRFFKEKMKFGEIDPSEDIKTPNRNTEKLPFKEVYRKNDVIALPDLHGDFEAFQNTLKDHNLINENGEWIGGDKRVQILGDIFDRGPNGVKILEKLIEYKKKGAQVDFIIGNHESFVLPALLGDSTGMYRWVINEKSGSIPKVTEAFQENPELFEMFKSSKLIEQVDDVLYMHAELSDGAATVIEKYGIDGINRIWQKTVSKALEGDLDGMNKSLEEFFPLLWSRAITRGKYATAENKQRISHVLKQRGINLVVHGHSPFDSAKGYKVGDVKVLDIDVKMSSGMNDEGKSRTGGLEVKKKGELDIYNPKKKRQKVVNI